MVKLTNVKTFDMGAPKEKALKPLEEAAEVFGAYQNASDDLEKNGAYLTPQAIIYDDMFYEIADCITACCNLACYFGCEDLTPYLERVEKHNEERGRYGKRS